MYFIYFQIQVVCDHERKIRDVFIGYPGSVHDSRVFRTSPLSQTIENKCGQYFLLGDSGYPLTKNLLTPFKDRGQLNENELNYNLQLARNRYIVEHCFGILKQKFRQLYHLKLRDMVYIVHFIRAACVLHNLAIHDDIDQINEDPVLDPVQENQEDNVDEDVRNEPEDPNAQRNRNRVVQELARLHNI